MSALGSAVGTPGPSKSPSVTELIAQVKSLRIAVDETSEEVATFKITDDKVRKSQRKLVKLPTPPRFKGVPGDLEG